MGLKTPEFNTFVYKTVHVAELITASMLTVTAESECCPFALCHHMKQLKTAKINITWHFYKLIILDYAERRKGIISQLALT